VKPVISEQQVDAEKLQNNKEKEREIPPYE
jgi:hypothetical protein